MVPSGVCLQPDQGAEIAPDIAIEATHLPGIFHADPADRIIVATARVHGITIITSDVKIRTYRHVSALAAS
jgi:PIN domain nuclease of toxin-antitoxin system